MFQIPAEITEHALTFLHPLNVAQFSQTCHLAYTMVYGSSDQYLWRQLFLTHPFDDPHKSNDGPNSSVPYNWLKVLQSICVLISYVPERGEVERCNQNALKWIIDQR